MSDENIDKNGLKFPLMCQYRIISLDVGNVRFVIETVLMELGITSPLKEGQTSNGGKYISTIVDVVVDSRGIMEKIHKELMAIEGVKMVL